MHLLFIRHGETDWNNEGRVQGHTDTLLNATGVVQAHRLAARLAGEKLDAVYASPLARAFVTATIVAQKCRLAPIADERLKEKRLGVFEGLTLAEMEQQYPDFYRQWRESKAHHVLLPGEESPAEFHQRAQTFLADLRAQYPNGARLAIVSHGGTIGMLITALIGYDIYKRMPFWFDNASLSYVDVSGSRPRIKLLNDTCHLQMSK